MSYGYDDVVFGTIEDLETRKKKLEEQIKFDGPTVNLKSRLNEVELWLESVKSGAKEVDPEAFGEEEEQEEEAEDTTTGFAPAEKSSNETHWSQWHC